MNFPITVSLYHPRDYPTLYLDYLNNFLTVEYFSEYYGMSLEQGMAIVTLGRVTDNFTKNWKKES